MSEAEIKPSIHFWLRRLHSLSGIFPIGVFLLEHMFTNAFILGGPEAYNHKIEFLRSLPFVAFIEITFIGIPILYHALYGLYVWGTGKSNLTWYPYPRNFLYTLQRWTGLIALIYIGYHAYHTRIVNALFGTEVSYARMAELVSVPWVFWFYVVGLFAVMFHFANGIWGFLISWGITVSQKSQKIAGLSAALVSLALFSVGISSLIHLVNHP
ncbi:MAG: succinate dehydrogenase [Candidatus Omnitrophica bacterium]|nr:succinate dehydrogenase [Candidatus Omnitrophota bacterium]